MKRLGFLLLAISSLLNVGGQTTVRYTTPEAVELYNIACALTDAGKKGTNGIAIIDTTQPYYRKLWEQFRPHQTHPLIAALNKKLEGNIGYFISNQNFANAYRFSGDSIVFDNIFSGGRTLAQRVRYGDAFKSFGPEFTSFVRSSNFRNFYKAQQQTYDSMHKAMQRLAPLAPMLDWLNAKFGTINKNFIVISSALIDGNHSTFEDKTGNVHIVVSDGYDLMKSSLTFEEQQARYTGILFTEINHHYCNPAAEKFSKEVNAAFGKRELWVDDTKATAAMYRSAQKVFNEYFTHSTYLLYIKDKFPAAVYQKVRASRIKAKEETNGWRRFGAFHEQMEKAYATRNKNIPALLPQILDWCKTATANP